MTPWPVEIATDGTVSCGALLWHFQRRLFLTVVVKATFSLTPDGTVVPTSPVEIVRNDRMVPISPTKNVREDRTYYLHPLRSIEAASDLAPYLPHCDVTLTGHAHAPVGRSTTSARLALYRDAQLLLDKTLRVHGDRDEGATLQPFTRMPLVYERALGGPGIECNPVGVDVPNVVDPTDSRKPAGFGAISRTWPARKRLLDAIDRKALERVIAEIPDAMPWAYYQAAPPDQQIEYLRGGEWLVLDGLHPTLTRLKTRLMDARGEARVHAQRAGGAVAALELVADTLAIDADAQQCSIVWRGRHEVAGGEASLPALFVAAGLQMPGRPVAWVRIVPTGGDRPAARPAPAAGPGWTKGTIELSPEQAAFAAQKPAFPFVPAATPVAPAAPARPRTAPTPRREETASASASAAPAKPSSVPSEPAPDEPGALVRMARPATILFLGANPSATTRIALDREVRDIGERLRGSKHRDAFRLQQEWAVRATDLQERLLRHGPAIVHFSGHGSSASELLLEDETGNARPVTATALAGLFRALRGDIRCVLLIACFSETQARAIAEHVDCVVGMTTAIEDRSAIAFAGAFYQALGYGKDVQKAFELGCSQMDLAGLGYASVPRLIVREGVRVQDLRFLRSAGRRS